MEMCTDKAVVRTPSAPTPSTAIPQILRTVGAPEGALLGASNPRSRLTVHSTSPTPATAQALINCGHIYHLSCARRWFQTKGKSERGRPAHAPCPKCKEPYKPDQKELDHLIDTYGRDTIEADMPDYDFNNIELMGANPEGCDDCGGTGYKGRTGIHELLVGTPTLQGMIYKKAELDDIRRQALKDLCVGS